MPQTPIQCVFESSVAVSEPFQQGGGGGGVVLRLVAGSPTAQLAMNKDYKSLLSLNGLE